MLNITGMKLYNKINKGLMLTLLAIAPIVISCEKSLDINENPNSAKTSKPELVLPTGQVGAALAMGDWEYIGSMWGQYWTGGPGVSTDGLEVYNMLGIAVERSWTRAYALSLADLDFVAKGNQPIYAGMARISMVHLYQMLTDFFGDIPMSEALKGAISDGSVLTPKYDTPEEVYARLIPMIDQAILELQTPESNSVKKPGAEDLIYAGDIDNWLAFANTLKLKVLVRQGKFTEAKLLMDSGVDFIGDSNPAGVKFNSASKNANPIWTRFAGSSLGMYYVAAASSIENLKDLNDPRIDKLYLKPTNPAGAPHRGIRSGDGNVDSEYALVGAETAIEARKKYSNVNPLIFSPTAPVFFISSWESYFLQAEVLIRVGDASAETKFNEAVQSSFSYLGINDASSYLSSLNFGSASQDEKLNILAVQKWISMNCVQMAEGWLETARLDRQGNYVFSKEDGVFTNPTRNGLGERIYPSSFVYPTQEVSLNPNTPVGRKVSDKRFWDN